MSLDLPTVVSQIEQLAESAVRRAAELDRRLPNALDALQACARLPAADLQRRIQRAGTRWRGARPAHEPATAAFRPPPHPAQLDVLGADGSQIYPSRHGAELFFLVNIGSLHYQHGSGQPPECASRPELFFEEADLFAEYSGATVSAEEVDARRDVAEMAELARLASRATGGSLALLDNGLLLWIALEQRDLNRRLVDRFLEQYFEHMTVLRRSGAALAGFVDRPRSADVLNLAHLASLPEADVDEAHLRATPFRGLTDRMVFASRLAPGERSALFVDGSPVNGDFRDAGHEVWFFYLRPGPEDHLARVEVPAWVAEDDERLARVHAGIIEQSRVTGIPYVLVRAHELALVAQADRQRLEEILSGELLRRGRIPRISQKALTKRWTGAKRRHRL
jgi:hypothetical protein